MCSLYDPYLGKAFPEVINTYYACAREVNWILIHFGTHLKREQKLLD